MEKIWKDEYINSMKTIKFSDNQKANMVQLLANTDIEGEGNIDMLEEKSRRHNLAIKRLAVAGICVCTLVVGTAGANASGLLKPVSEVFSNIFHLNGDTTEIVDKMGNSLNASDNSAGVTITADAVLGDDYNYAVVFSIKKDDGTSLDSIMDKAPIDTWLFESMILEEDPFPSAAAYGSYSYFDNTNSDDSSVQFVSLVSSDSKINGKKMTATFSNLGYDKEGEFVNVVEGEWKLNFQIDFPDSTVQLQAGQHLQTDTIDMIIQAIQISPIGFYIEFEDSDDTNRGEVTENTEDLEKENAFTSIPIVLTLSNGEKLTVTDSSSITKSDEGGFTYTHRGIFDRIIPIDEMESIRVGDIDIKITA